MKTAPMLTTAAGAALLLTGCGDGAGGGGSSGEGNALSGAQKVEAIASTLQACSYEGKPVTTPASAIGGAAPSDCSQAVNRIMDYTGLPANFVVVSGPVDNAAAVILLDANKIPRRVIAFNPQFMQQAAARVGGDPWGPISIMAHEIAHHLSGHTIVPGGSRPEIELEADKFSGFVLQKMGAPLDDATKMILTVGTDHASPTHPGKQQRADAIRQGWEESRRQSGTPSAGPAPIQPIPVPSAIPSAVPAVATVRALPQPGSIPFKYGRFIIDETGKLDPARVRAMETKLYSLAKDVGAEFSVLVINDLKGMSAQDYAWAMMRQLRIGKLDVGNGAVVVVAPRQRQAAVAFGPGFAKEAEFSKPEQQLLRWIDEGWGYCDDADGCKQWTDALFGMFDFTLSNVRNTKWTIDYPTMGALMAHYKQVNDQRMRTKRPFDSATDQPIGNLLRVRGKITSLTPPPDATGVDGRLTGGKLGYTAVGMMTDDGYPVTLYVSPRLAPLMPAGKLRADTRYTLVGRLQRSGDKASKQPAAMWLFSYDPI